MPKSRIRTKKGRRPQKTKADIKKIENGYFKKLDDFLELSLVELKEIEESGKTKGIYAVSLKSAIDQKEQIEQQIKKKNNEEAISDPADPTLLLREGESTV